MYSSSPARLFLLVAVALPFLATFASAQSVLLVEHKQKGHVVRAARREMPLIDEKGKLVPVDGRRFVLKPVEEYLPVFVSVRGVNVRTSRVDLVDSGQSINHQFEFHAEFASGYPLDNVFVVLELHLSDGSRTLFLNEVGKLRPRRPNTIDLVVRTPFGLGEGNYRFHVFVDGLEALHSEQPFQYREAMLDKMVAKRAADRPDSPPEPFVGPLPEYPTKLLKSKQSGKVVLKLRIRRTGAVVDPEVISASAPEFGEAAVAAFRQWRFLPSKKNGHAVDATVTMPLAFEPPETRDSGS